tara:strand:- start:45 stop:341 length:297 start_codon:yes stop_codon:yes gene_type:complete
MPRMMSLQEFLKSGSSTAIKTYKNTGVLPTYVAKPRQPNSRKMNIKGPAGKTGKSLSTFYGDPKKTTRGDVIAAAIAKKKIVKKRGKKKAKKIKRNNV